MPQNVSGWWTDEKVRDTVTSRYVHSHLRPNEAEQLTKSVFGDLSDDTYLEWILTRAKRFFLTLVDAGVPDQIFGIIDDSFDDEDLPVPEDEVATLRLALDPDRSLDRRFYKAQFKYLVRVVDDGEHIRYANEETLPVVPVNGKPLLGNSGKDVLDKVTLPSTPPRVYSRKRVKLVNRMTEEDTLNEIVNCKRLAHGHVLSVFGSYTTGDDLFILLTPAVDFTLKSFLSDTPKAFDLLTKAQRRRTLLNWPHCLANGLAWLHANGRHHGCVRPSRIHIDEHFQISLGQLDGDGILGSNTVKDDIEAYQYAAPERWKRSVTVQSTGNTRVTLPSGGRTGRKVTLGGGDSASIKSGSDTSGRRQGLSTMRPTSTSYAFLPTAKGNFSRLRIGMTSNEAPMRASIERTPSERTAPSRQSNRTIRSPDTIRGFQDDEIRGEELTRQSSNSSGGSARIRRTRMTPVFAAAPELRTAVVQTWASAQHDMLAADIFALGAVIMDLLSVLCKYSCSAFAKHRSSKNRVAGRGGGLADASFHANLVAVGAWAQMLHKDAEKRIKKEDGTVFRAVGPILQIVMQCLEREPNHRLSAEELARKLDEHIRDFADIKNPHCTFDLNAQERPRVGDRNETKGVAKSHNRRTGNADKEVEKQVDRGLSESSKTTSQISEPKIESLSPVGKQFFNFDFDAGSETMVDENSTDGGSRARSPYQVSDRTNRIEKELAQALRSMSHRPKRVSWDIAEEEASRPETVQSMSSSTFSGKSLVLDQLRIPSSADRNSYLFPAPPSQSPSYELPPLPLQAPYKRPSRTASGNTGSRVSRLGGVYSSGDVS